MKHGKKYLEAAKAVDRSIQYDPADAISTVKKLATAKFDETIEVHIKTGCDGRHADQQIRGAVGTDQRLFCRTVPENRFVYLFSLKAQKLMRLLQQVQSSLELRS